ncbi:TRAP transporter substrate-binding protein [Bacillus sp. B15-48]|uniref:TRAP transporter substrate-binding protein n=1 Tax=Bacillus sp. B15-48 TaxID=1548601 RepID=UPI00193EF052|nr:TRAP transporter substrate-binding protein [Bacillus sp. B15-48]MBM4763650.1 DctP family TRAP transporter solute-binding subunit [Bacillus sp. B15-48]
MKKKNSFLVVTLLLFFSLLLSACGSNSSSGSEGTNGEGNGSGSGNSERVIKIGHVTADSHLLHLSAEKFKEEVEEKSDGKIRVEIYPQQQLGTEPDMMEQMKNGSLDMVWSTIANLTTKSEALNAWNMPFLIEDFDTLKAMVDTDLALEILGSLDESEGTVPIGYITIDNRHIFSLKPITTMGDLRGLKVRIPPGKATSDFYEAIGASPTPVSMQEVYSSLQTGVLDAADVDVDAVLSNRYYEVGKHVTLTGHHDWVIAQLYSQVIWDKMTAEEQQIVLDAAKVSSDYSYEITVQKHDEFIEEAKEQGVTFHDFEDMGEIRAIAQEIQDEYASKNPLINEFIEKVKEIKAQ